jgi:hypothetical protein
LDDLKEARRYWKLKEEASLEGAMDLLQDRLLLDLSGREDAYGPERNGASHRQSLIISCQYWV